MSILEILLIGIGLSMDACAVSATNGMCNTGTGGITGRRSLRRRDVLLMALLFGLFQGLMPLIGYYAGSVFSAQIATIDHWIALVLLVLIGGKMLYDGLHHDSACPVKPLSIKLLLLQAFATSIDALAVGVSFAAMNVNIYLAVSLIAATTFLLCPCAVLLGKKIGDKLNSKAEVFGGLVLVFIGLKIFIEHMFF